MLVGFYLSTYVVHRFAVPLGWDTTGYAWRTALAERIGIANLPAAVPSPGPANPGRPAFVVLAALARSAFRATPFAVAEALPGVLAAAAGLAAGVVVTSSLRRAWWELACVALLVGTSAFMVNVINLEGYQDTAIAVTVFLAASVAILVTFRERGGLPAAVVLITAAALAHWSFFVVLAAVLLAAALVWAPASLRKRTSDESGRRAGSSVRVLVAGVLGGVLAALLIRVGLSAPFPAPDLVAGQFVNKLTRDLSAYHPWIVFPVAAAGALLLSAEASREEGEARASAGALLVFLLAWCEVAVAAFLGQRIFGWAIPVHRILAFTLAVPILVSIAVLGLGRRLAPVARPLAWTVTAILIALSAWAGYAHWTSFRPVIRPAVLSEAAAAGAYLDRADVAEDDTVVFVIEPNGGNAVSDIWLTGHTIRAGLQAARVPHVYFYVGEPQDFLSGKLSLIPPATPTDLPARDLPVETARMRNAPSAIVLSAANSSYGRWVAAHPESEVAPGVAVLRGPIPSSRPAGAATSPLTRFPGAWPLAFLATGLFVLFAAVGGGWTMVLLGPWLRDFEVVALAPAVGVAVLVVGGVVAGALRVPTGGAGPLVVAVLAGALGWGAVAWRARSGRLAGGFTTA